MFEKATRMKLRYKVTNGVVTTEDLWDLSLITLDSLARSLHKELKESEEISFIQSSLNSRKNAKLELQFEIVKHIISVKLAEQELAKNKEKMKERKEALLEVLHSKQTEEMKSKSVEEILKELEELE